MVEAVQRYSKLSPVYFKQPRKSNKAGFRLNAATTLRNSGGVTAIDVNGELSQRNLSQHPDTYKRRRSRSRLTPRTSITCRARHRTFHRHPFSVLPLSD